MTKAHSNDSDEFSPAELVERIAAGDGSAERELFAKYYRPVFLLLLNRCNNHAQAEDLSQDTFELVLQKLRSGQIEHPERLTGFIRQVAHNLFIGEYRRIKRQNTQTASEELVHIESSNRTAEMEMQLSELKKMVHQMLGEMKQDRDRQILRLHYLTLLEKPTICERLGLSPNHYDRVIFRAKQRLRELAVEKNIFNEVGEYHD